MEHLVLPHHTIEGHGLDHHAHEEVHLPSLRSDERIGEILCDSKEAKSEDAGLRYKPEDFLMLLPQEGSGEYMPPPNPFQSACAMCTTCKRVLVFPANAEDSIQCPACKKLVDVDTLAESKLLRSCPQCDTLLVGNPTNAPKVLCPLCMKLIEWNAQKEVGVEGETPKKKRSRKAKEESPMSPSQEGSPSSGDSSCEVRGGLMGSAPSKKKKGYIKKGEPGYVRPKYSYIKKGQPGYVRPKYNYVKKGQPGYVKPRSKKRSNSQEDLGSPIIKEDMLTPKMEEVAAAAALLNTSFHSIENATVETVSEGIVREVTELVRHQ